MMELCCFRVLVFVAVINVGVDLINGESFDDIYSKQKENQWFKDGIDLIEKNLKQKIVDKKAKGVILFIGDGMGISTVSAARILDGQLKGMTGEENVLSWERFHNVALSKTYNTNAQTGDSAGTATAFMTGVKARSGVISVNENVIRRNCTSSVGQDVLSIIMMAENAGLSTGVVTTARVTHATPSTAYANSADRNWECDADLKNGINCKDIARQLIEFNYGDGIDLILGGGRKNFYPKSVEDFEEKGEYGKREDGRNLTLEWMKKSMNHKFVWNYDGFKNLHVNKQDHILGLFNRDHMQYNYQRKQDKAGEPSLTEMVEFAVKKLQLNPEGYVLLVEAGRIDHGHHASKPVLALHDAVEMARAVEKAVNITKFDETLIIASADHSHVFTFGGYQPRGNPIFGLTPKNARDGMKYSTLSYANGPGGMVNSTRKDPQKQNLTDPEYRWQSLVPLSSETHGGEDVGIYASGPQAHLIRGVVEQNYIFHVMDYALCLSESKKSICKKEGLLSAGSQFGILVYMHAIIATTILFNVLV